MRWVTDRTGRFPQRPHYEPEELDEECEMLIGTFLRAKHGVATYPVTTNDLTILIEREVESLDPYADLSQEGDDVEGVTDFTPGRKPRVRIASELSEQAWRENRLRTTLTHELGHVKFHNFLWSFDQAVRVSLFSEEITTPPPRCKRETILGASVSDWMEWQAGYASGALLMPRTPLRQVVRTGVEATGAFGPISLMTPAGQDLIHRVQLAFQVSADAARVRLLQLRLATEQPPVPSLLTPPGS